MESTYKRVLLKLSGEALAGDQKFGVNYDAMVSVAEQIKTLVQIGVEVGIVIGAGNFWRGRTSDKMNRCTGDHMGMLATVMNSLAMQDALDFAGVENVVMSSLEINRFADSFNQRKACEHLSEGKVVIFAGGTGLPFFSTDTAAALRAAEIGADVILLAKNIDGVYDKDPNKYDDAKKYERLTHTDVVNNKLGVMDLTASTICMDNSITILVFDLKEHYNIVKVCTGENIGTIIEEV